LEVFRRERRYVEEEKPYWVNLTGGTRFSGPLQYELENYFPEAHYRRAIEQIQDGMRIYDEDGDAGALLSEEEGERVDAFTEPGSGEYW
jgi:hypothetical protein